MTINLDDLTIGQARELAARFGAGSAPVGDGSQED